MKAFMKALPTASRHSDAHKQSLVQLEIQLTHETFGCWPELFHRVFHANAQLAREVSTAMVNLDVIGSDFDTPRALITQNLHRLTTEWIDLSEPIDVVSGTDSIYTKYIESQARRREIMERLLDYKYLLANPTPEMYAKARTRARVFDEGGIAEQGSATVAAELSNDLPQQDQEFHVYESNDHHGARSQQQHPDFRIHEDPVVTAFGVDPSEVEGALQNLMLRPVSPDVPFGQENEDPMTGMLGEREASAETVQGDGEVEGRGEGGREDV